MGGERVDLGGEAEVDRLYLPCDRQGVGLVDRPDLRLEDAAARRPEFGRLGGSVEPVERIEEKHDFESQLLQEVGEPLRFGDQNRELLSGEEARPRHGLLDDRVLGHLGHRLRGRDDALHGGLRRVHAPPHRVGAGLGSRGKRPGRALRRISTPACRKSHREEGEKAEETTRYEGRQRGIGHQSDVICVRAPDRAVYLWNR
jgi:hypothetical protein